VPVDNLEIEQNFGLHPLSNTQLSFTFQVKDQLKSVNWFSRSWVARHRPIRFRITFEDVDGLTFSKVMEYVFSPPQQTGKKENDALFLFIDDCDTFDRTTHTAQIQYDPLQPDSNVFQIEGKTFDTKELKALVFKSKQESVFEQNILDSTSSDISKKAWALIDDNTNRVYGVKMLLSGPFGASMGYFKVPLYGNPVTLTKPIKPANESVVFPDVTPIQLEKYVQDDNFDDELIPIGDTPTTSTGTTGGAMAMDPNLLLTLSQLNENMKIVANSMSKIDSVERNIARIADSFEKLVDIMIKK